ncbi:MAG: glycosyltransferase family 2 protein [Gammaproteobacteria bacterium]|nr:glycosyltransferase family 2 protein [Gammaproteobacteria bacterium]
MEELNISVFRYLVIAIAVLGLIGLLRLVHKRKIAGYEFVLWGGVLVSTVILGFFPRLIVHFFDYVNLSSSTRYDRLIQLGYIFSFITLSLVFYYRYKLDSFKTLFIRTIQAPLVKGFVSDNKELIDNVKILILIPAFNEEGNLLKIIQRIPEKICGIKPHVLIISDGSTDQTTHEAISGNAILVEHPTNFGQCMAYRTGYQIATVLHAEYVIHLDADGQYQPEEIELLLTPILNNEADIVSGSRLLGKYEQFFSSNHRIRSFGVLFFNLLLTVLTGNKITDSASGFRAIRAKYLPMLTLKQEQFHSSELLIESLKKGAVLKEVPVTFLKRISGDSKKPDVLRYSYGFINAILRTWMRK